jgi:hypothetical protein
MAFPTMVFESSLYFAVVLNVRFKKRIGGLWIFSEVQKDFATCKNGSSFSSDLKN